MSQNTVRLHLNSRDARPNGGDVNNNADVVFDLRKVGIQASPGKLLTASLIKASIPTTLTAVISDLPAIVFSVSTADAPNIAGEDLTIYCVGDRSSSDDFIYSATEKRNVYYAMYDYTIGNLQLIGFLNEVVEAQSATPGNLFELTLDGRLTGTGLSFKNLDNAMSRRLGIDVNSGPIQYTPLKYPMTSYQEPLIVTTNLNVNSVGSRDKGSQSNILSSIPINLTVTNQSTTLAPLTTSTPLITSTPPETEQKVNLDGSNDHINIPMDSGNPVLNWDESWSIGFTAEEIHDAASGVGVKRTIATRGTNGIYLIIGTGNVGFYASATDGVYDPANNQGMTHAHGANTWYPTPASVKWLFTYNHVDGKLRWYVGEVSNLPSYVQRGVITMTATERTINQSAEDLNIGDAMDGYYGSTYFDGHLDDLLITNNEMTGQQVVDYFTDDDFQSHEYSEHIVSQYNFNQTFPNVDDQVGSYNASHQGSSNPDNFIPN
jgi:hypothetical protein